ncbi:hypothetical protein FRB99_002166 [Tulasnella sp. 403]|nr:hypothetical protein FRB99_002166 [Tulasnella sp. 403]
MSVVSAAPSLEAPSNQIRRTSSGSMFYYSGAVLARETTPYTTTTVTESSQGPVVTYTSITCMPQYRALSFEELRLSHYFYKHGDKVATMENDNVSMNGSIKRSSSRSSTAPLGPIPPRPMLPWEKEASIAIPTAVALPPTPTVEIELAENTPRAPLSVSTVPPNQSPRMLHTPFTPNSTSRRSLTTSPLSAATPTQSSNHNSMFNGPMFGLERSSSIYRPTSEPEIDTGLLDTAERDWEESRRELAAQKAALLKAKAEYDAALLNEKTKFKAYSDLRMQLLE